MTWTYSGDPTFSKKDEVRFLLGDTNSDSQRVSDEEIEYTLTSAGNNAYSAAARCARSLAALYATKVDKAVGDLNISWSQLAQNFASLAAQLEGQVARRSSPRLYAGGISVSDKDSEDLRTDRVEPRFKSDMFTNRQAR